MTSQSEKMQDRIIAELTTDSTKRQIDQAHINSFDHNEATEDVLVYNTEDKIFSVIADFPKGNDFSKNANTHIVHRFPHIDISDMEGIKSTGIYKDGELICEFSAENGTTIGYLSKPKQYQPYYAKSEYGLLSDLIDNAGEDLAVNLDRDEIVSQILEVADYE